MTWSPFLTLVTPGADLDDDAGALVAEDRREQALGIGARQRELVGVADAGRLDLDQHLAGLRALEVDLDDLERLAGREGDGCAGLHDSPPSRLGAGILVPGRVRRYCSSATPNGASKHGIAGRPRGRRRLHRGSCPARHGAVARVAISQPGRRRRIAW